MKIALSLSMVLLVSTISLPLMAGNPAPLYDGPVHLGGESHSYGKKSVKKNKKTAASKPESTEEPAPAQDEPAEPEKEAVAEPAAAEAHEVADVAPQTQTQDTVTTTPAPSPTTDTSDTAKTDKEKYNF